MEELRETMDEESGTTEGRGNLEGEIGMALQRQPEILPPTEFVKVEKNLASLGFFTPSSKRLRNAQEKSFTITTIADGKRMELKGTIIPSAKYGLPITADQDKWIALCKILTDIMRKEGRVTNPVAFTSAEILRLLHKHRHSGKNYREVEEWLDVLFSTTIFSEGVVYLANEKRRVKDRFRVFDRAVSFGKELSEGRIADKNYVWLSEWQLQNINANHLLPIDLEAYRELKNHISKALVPLLQVWLHATREDGVFQKRYDELCQMLNIRQYAYLSLITRTLAPSLDELTEYGYLADWSIERTSDDEHYKILFYHGEKFHRDRQARLNRKGTPGLKDHGTESDHANADSPQRVCAEPRKQTVEAVPLSPTFDPALVAEFTSRGITEDRALALLANVKPGRDVIAQLEHAEQSVKNSKIEIRNPAAYIARLIELDTPVPDGFETRAQRKVREDREQQQRTQRAMRDAEQQLEWDYEDYQETEIDRYIEGHRTEFEALKEAKSKEDRERFRFTTESMTVISAKNEIRKKMTFLTFEEFLDRRKQGTDFSLKPVAVSPAAAGEPEVRELRPMPIAEPVVEATSNRALLLLPEPVMPEPPVMIELASEPLPPPNELDGDAAANLA
jgi:hypothetical protein